MAFWNTGGIQKRWMLRNIGMIMFVLLLFVAASTFVIATNLYSSMKNDLANRVRVDTNNLAMYQTKSEYLSAVREFTDSYQDSSKIEVQYLLNNGKVEQSSYSLTLPGSVINSPDIVQAKETSEIADWMGKNQETGERILSVSAPLVFDGETQGVLRYVTSLRLVNQQILFYCGSIILIAIAILLMIYFSNIYFVRSIVNPVVQITGVAKRIADGSYGIQVERRSEDKLDDEIGDLLKAINDMSKSIQQAENMKSEFISSVSHELRTPLTAINGWAETIMNGGTRDETDVKKGMGIIASEAKRLTTMVEELLEFSRIEEGRFTLSVEPMDIKAELEDALYTYGELFVGEGITLSHSDCEEDIAPILGDPDRLRQVFCNLLDNAVKHGGTGKKIDTAIFLEQDEVVITIRDYGNGIPEDELTHVKEKFYKGSSLARGSGIGLAVCEEVISLHDGTLTVENAEGGGCKVSIRLKYRKNVL